MRGDILKNKKGQIWVETVIYMLVAFAMISLVLAFVRPKIEELRDKAIIDQSIEVINNLDKTFQEVLIPGNKRVVEVGIKKGDLIIIPSEDTIIIEIESSYAYSEPGIEISVGEAKVVTEERGKFNLVTITREYESYNILYQNQEVTKSLTRSPIPYQLVITNEGKIEGITQINMELI
jgi:hypothetical protein